jgi:hypothetical protein
MKVARVGVIAAVVLVVATIAFAQQQKPDFSGTWTPEPGASGATGGGTGGAGGTGGTGGGGGGGRGMGGPMTVKQTADTLTVERTMGDNKVSTNYKLDGSETKVQMGRGGEGTATAKWDANKLVITTKSADGANTNTQTWSLDGGVLTIERTGGRGPSTVKYKKTT